MKHLKLLTRDGNNSSWDYTEASIPKNRVYFCRLRMCAINEYIRWGGSARKGPVPFTGFRYMKVWKLLWVFKRAFHWKKSWVDASYGFSLLYRYINFLKLRGLKRNSAQLRERCTIFNGRYTKGLPFLSKLVYAWVIVRGSSYTLSSVLRTANLQIIQCV